MHFPERGARQHLQLHCQDAGTTEEMLMSPEDFGRTQMLEGLYFGMSHT